MFGFKKPRSVNLIVADLTAMQTELNNVIDEEEIFQKERNDEITELQKKVEVSKFEASRAGNISKNIGSLLDAN